VKTTKPKRPPKATASRKAPAARRIKAALPKRVAADPNMWDLRLYVAGQTPKSLAAFSNLKKLCEEHLAGKYHIEIIDLLKEPESARTDAIFAIPTLVRRLPSPIRKIIGDLSNTDRALIGLDLRAAV